MGRKGYNDPLITVRRRRPAFAALCKGGVAGWLARRHGHGCCAAACPWHALLVHNMHRLGFRILQKAVSSE